jgi:ATP sulfurylase
MLEMNTIPGLTDRKFDSATSRRNFFCMICLQMQLNTFKIKSKLVNLQSVNAIGQKKMRKAIFQDLDPITLGHEDIIKRGILFDEIAIAIGVNAKKIHDYSRRAQAIEETLRMNQK